MTDKEKPKRKRRTKAEMEAARSVGLDKPAANVKPPTQGVGVVGINDSAFGSDTHGIRWDTLIHLPKFQAFCIERSKLSYENVMDWIIEFVLGQLNNDVGAFFKDYEEWHDAKGYWKNETIYGELIEDGAV